jgi:hypothetical protein
VNQKQDGEKFETAFDEFCACYPGRRFEGGAKKAYWFALQKSSIWDVEEAFHRAPTVHPTYPASAGELAVLAAKVCTERLAERELKAKEAAERAEEERVRVAFGRVPRTPQAQAAYMAEGATEAEKLARYFECESVGKGLDPNQATPDECGAARMRALQGLVEKIGGAK